MKVLVFLLAAAACTAARGDELRIERSTILTSTGPFHWAQSRAAAIPGNRPTIFVATQQYDRSGSHGYRDVYFTETKNGGESWSEPSRIPSLARGKGADGVERVMGDICPQWHAATQTVLLTGKTFGFRPDPGATGDRDDRSFERVAYAVFSPSKGTWTEMKTVTLPEKDHAGRPILEPNSGCHQRVDLPNGEILLPIRYRANPESRQYTTMVARCTFDGNTLAYREHGSELTFEGKRGLYEPSVVKFGDRYFLTMRADESAFVSVSDDGLNYSDPVEWKFDDGAVLGNYNSQQHWIVRGNTLYLVYPRRGANNDHVFRHRAPLFIARVDAKKLNVIRASEQVLMPETGVDLAGGFGVVDYGNRETWVVSTEMGFPQDRRQEPNRVLLARILWND